MNYSTYWENTKENLRIFSIMSIIIQLRWKIDGYIALGYFWLYYQYDKI